MNGSVPGTALLAAAKLSQEFICINPRIVLVVPAEPECVLPHGIYAERFDRRGICPERYRLFERQPAVLACFSELSAGSARAFLSQVLIGINAHVPVVPYNLERRITELGYFRGLVFYSSVPPDCICEMRIYIVPYPAAIDSPYRGY